MKKNIYLGKTISRLGFGAWPLGNTAYDKTMSIDEGVSLVKEALEQGINFFDTAPNYALGRSEMILGEALQDVRESVVINSKFGHHADGVIDFNEGLLEASVKGSLKRLKTTYLDSLILHNPTLDVLAGKTNHFKILEDLKQKGMIHGYGASVDSYEELSTLLKHQSVDVIELLFHVFAQSTRALFSEIEKRGIALIIKVPLDSGWLSGKYTKETTFDGIKARWSASDKQRRHQLVCDLKALVQEDALAKYALGFLWSYDAVTTVIPGIRTKNQLEEHLKAQGWRFPSKLKVEFEQFYDTKIKSDPLPW